ncbi:MAG: hypothetical protein ACJ788_21295 [Ktedonobacteraceae bacterium]|jgi:hypothetical protein
MAEASSATTNYADSAARVLEWVGCGSARENELHPVFWALIRNTRVSKYVTSGKETLYPCFS